MVAIPVVGDLVIQSSMYRFASNLALLLRSGVPMLETMDTIADVFRGQPPYHDAIEHAKNRMAAGRALADGLEESGLFTSMMINAVRVGEESAQLGPVMEELAPYYREKTQAFMSRVTKLAEPAHHHGDGGRHQRRDACDLHPDVRDGRKREMMKASVSNRLLGDNGSAVVAFR